MSKGLMRLSSPAARRSTSSVLIAFDASLRALEDARIRRDFANQFADVAQLAEQPPRKWQGWGSTPTVGSMRSTHAVRRTRGLDRLLSGDSRHAWAIAWRFE